MPVVGGRCQPALEYPYLLSATGTASATTASPATEPATPLRRPTTEPTAALRTATEPTPTLRTAALFATATTRCRCCAHLLDLLDLLSNTTCVG